MEGLIPWQQLEDRIEPFYAKAGRGRRPYPLGVMLRVHCVQLFYNPSDPGMEDLLYEVESVRRFAGLRLSGPLPVETMILNFRHLLECTQGLGNMFEEINVHLASLGHRLKTGTIVVVVAWRERERYRGSSICGNHMNLGSPASTRLADGLRAAFLARRCHQGAP